jgi:hypothetical protein
VVDCPAGEKAPSRESRLVATAPVFASSAKPAKPLSALSRDPHHDDQRGRAAGGAVMTAEALWAAAGLARIGDHDDTLEPIFTVGRSREIYLIEHGMIETGAEVVLRLP